MKFLPARRLWVRGSLARGTPYLKKFLESQGLADLFYQVTICSLLRIFNITVRIFNGLPGAGASSPVLAALHLYMCLCKCACVRVLENVARPLFGGGIF
jgi:hypothetical protein